MGLPIVLLVLALLYLGTVAIAVGLQETWVIVLGTIVCMWMITLYLPPQTDVERTWECVSGSQEILWVHVLDGYEHCLDRSDEFESGFFDDYTEAEEAALLEDGGYLVDSFQTWWAAIALVIQFAIVLPFSWVTQILVDEVLLQKLLRKGDSRRVRTEKLIRSEASKKRRRGAKKKQARENLQALIQMPKRIQGIEKSIETFDGQIEDFQRSLNSTRDEISSANDQIKHLVPYI